MSTVSSMSLTMPKSTSSPITWIRAVAEAPSAVRSVASAQPGSSPGLGSRASTLPDRSVATSCSSPPTVTHTGVSSASAVTKLRHPRRRSSASPVVGSYDGGASSTRAKTRTKSRPA